MDNDEHEHDRPRGFFQVDANEFFERQREAANYHEVQITELKTAMDNFLDSLDPEQAFALSRMTQVMVNNPHYIHIVTGQLSILLRRIHKVCQSCGDPGHPTEGHLTATAVLSQVSVGSPRLSNEANTEISNALSGLTVPEMIQKLNVLNSNEPPAVACKNCGIIYKDMWTRVQAGLKCPNCLAREVAYIQEEDRNLSVGDLMTRFNVGDSDVNEDAVVCLGCLAEFPTLKFRMEQGKDCPTCAIKHTNEATE